MSDSVGILAYGSLIGNPGSEIEKATRKVVSGVKTPFRVEFARSSRRRGGAPTLVPVESGGCEVNATIFVADLPVEAAENCLYRREINKVGSGLVYEEPKKITPDKMVARRLADFAGIGTVLHTEIAANIHPAYGGTPCRTRCRQRTNARRWAGWHTYLMDARANGIETPLTAGYAAEIMRQLDVANLEEALAKARAQGCATLVRAASVLSAVIWNIHLKRVMHQVDPAPRLNFWRLMYGNLLDMAVIEWCKLFGSDHEEHQPVHWKNIVPREEHDSFRKELLAQIKVSMEEWLQYRERVKHYRDNYAAHMSVPWLRPETKDKDRYPELGLALEVAYFYYEALLARLEAGGFPHRYPSDIREYCERFVVQVTEAAQKATAATADMTEKML